MPTTTMTTTVVKTVDMARVIMLQSGSCKVKAGFAGDDAPRATFPTLVGRPRDSVSEGSLRSHRHGFTSEESERECWLGHDAQSRYRLLTLKCPLKHGIVTNWDDMEKIWHHTFYNELQLDPAEHPVLLTEAPMNPKADRERTTQLMFDTFNVPSMHVALRVCLPLYASGHTTNRMTGIVLDSGDQMSHAVPIYLGYALLDAVISLDLGGHDVTEYFHRLITQSGYTFTTNAELETVRIIKEKLACIAPNSDIQSFDKEASYVLPGGNVIRVGKERARCAEILFQPGIIHKDSMGIADAVFKSIMECDIDVRKDLFGHIILSGGNTMFPGIMERMTKELTALAPSATEIQVVALEERKDSEWIGGSILCSLPIFPEMLISKFEYDQSGPGIVHTKCF